MSENEINNVHVLIRRFLYETDEILHDAEKCQKWLISFCKTLQFQDLCKEPNEYAIFLLKEAKEFNKKQQIKSQKKQVRKILKEQGIVNPTKAQVNEKWLEIFGQDDITAGAPNGNNGDCDHSRESASPDSTTACGKNSRGSARPSTEAPTRKNGDEHQTGCKTGVSESATSVDKTNSVCNTGSVQPVTRRESGKFPTERTAKKPLAGGMLPSSSLKPSASPCAVDVLSLAYSGEFGNVKLTQEQYAQLGIKFGNQQKLNRAIDSLSCQIENGEKNPANHYAELVKWANYRDDMEEQELLKASTAPHYETVSEHNARIIRESDKWIDEHFPPKRKAANG